MRPIVFPSFRALLLVLSFVAAAGCDASGVLDDDDDGSPPPDCEDLLVPALDWFDEPVTGSLQGTLEFGQTHVVASDESRLAPPPVEERETMLLFTPNDALEPGLDLRVAAFAEQTLLGVLRLASPERLPSPLEQGLTEVPLDPYSTTAWSTAIPWHWMRGGVELRIGHPSDEGIDALSHTLSGLGAPHTFTISRSKIVLFGEPDFDTATVPAPKLAQDFFATLPFAELRFVDSAPWRLDELVIPTDLGPRLVTSEDERQDLTNESDRWSVLKHQFALRMSLANTGRGLALTIPSEGDSSPYSFGTSLGLGWVRNGDGTYSDINNAPYAAGWTGWSALWLGECANVFNHEIGHSMTLLHFTDGAAASWGIADEYPQEGTNLATHPWGFDTTRRQFRTWYRVDSGGVVTDENGPVGKRDTMNGGEAANSLTCFPQYTAYHAWKIQDWAENSPTLMEHEGEAGVWRWNANTREYESEDVDPAFEEPTAVGVPVVTLTGTLGNDDGACQTYPANFWPSGNAFSLPDPTDPSLPANYEGARWFLEITYAEGSSDRALIARGAMDDTTSLALFSVNIESERAPISVSLYRADTAYPELDPEEAELIHTRLIEAPTSPMDPIVRVGRGFIANGDLLLEQRCSAGIDCDDRRKESTWRIASPPLFLEDSQGASPDAEQCLEEGGVVALELPATNEEGSLETVVVHAQRVMASSEGSVAVPMNDTTAWFGSPDTEQSLRVWMPYEANQDLPAGHYRGSGDLTVLGSLDGSPFSTTGLAVNLTVHDPIEVDLSSEYVSPGVGLSDSSVYYLVEDPSMGPNWALWWGGAGPTVLRVPVVNESTGEGTTLVLDAWKEACGSRWELNSGQASDWNCDHAVVLRASETGNEGLEAGHSYRSPGSSPLVVSAHRWHQPGAGEVLQTLALEILYAPTE